MSLRTKILKCIPYWVILLATDLRCLLRCSWICGPIGYQNSSEKAALIVAPHPDDETFGCGGLISMKLAAGVPVRVVLLTDGEAVASGLGEPPETVIAARRCEFTNACQKLGLETDALYYLHLADGSLPHPGQSGFPEAVKALAAQIENFAPSEIYCPHLLDVRPDHIAATLITHGALSLLGRSCAIFYYPVWMWYHASSGLGKRLDCRNAWRLDISTVLYAKKQAMAAYLNAPNKTAAGNPFCGRLPWSFLWNFKRPYEVYFPATDL